MDILFFRGKEGEGGGGVFLFLRGKEREGGGEGYHRRAYKMYQVLL